ncbi:mediator of RNA polymerase II transcription subunit 26 isoform X2 [Esox lucius]|uniref:mediator of RNA polymerase II transcription subunit 26 isoform X2 n=1 Tax=Esox lucius TaxID=8010 RepID=UPI001477305C|nr:mediator of RNA polymerase II transcription subunit 26 isoform X2 [Esox lucius]
MTTASATPQQMRDRLLQAIDSHSNIRNMVAVLEVITYLEKFPITKEALEETRLGKLINDVRKETKDKDLAKRAKKLLRSWQKLIEPGQNETPSRATANVPGSANGSAHPCRTDVPPPDVSCAGKGVPEAKTTNDVHYTDSPKAEKSSGRKRKGEQRERPQLPAKIPKLSSHEPLHNSDPPPPTNGIAGSPEAGLDTQADPSADRARTDHLENDKHSRIPINAVKPHPSSPGLAKLPSTSSLLKTAVLQQQARLDEGGGGQYQAKSPRSLSSSPRSPRSAKPEATSKRSSTYAPKGAIPSPARSPRLPLSLPLMSPAQVSHVDGPLPPAHRTAMHWPSLAQPPHSTVAPEAQPVFPPASQSTPHSSESAELHRPSSSVVVVRAEAEVAASSSDRKKRKKYRSRDFSVNLQGPDAEDKTKPVRLKERRLTFDPVTGQIKSSVHKEPSQVEESPRPAEPRPRTDLPTPQQPPVPSPFQQTNWKELSRNEIIQSYLDLQSNVLTSSGVQGPGAHFFMSEYLKREESDVREARRGVHVLQLDGSVTDMPGVSREVTEEDLRKVHTEHWHGVNGCHDTKGTWYDWTACISLDPHGDESKLNILPYVCLD